MTDDAFWNRMFENTSIYETVEKLRDAVDRRDWREVRAAQAVAERQQGAPPREVSDSLGTVTGRRYRQVNVKLSEPDFDVLRALAIERDVPPSLMARMLLRQSILAAGKSSTS